MASIYLLLLVIIELSKYTDAEVPGDVCSAPLSSMTYIGNKYYYMAFTTPMASYSGPADLHDDICRGDELVLGRLESLNDFNSIISFLNQKSKDEAYVNIFIDNKSCSNYSGCVLKDKDGEEIDLSFITTGANPSISQGSSKCALLNKNGVLKATSCSPDPYPDSFVICEHACPVNGQWLNWSSWTSCSVTCGSGNKTRSRTCTNPAPKFGGSNCQGLDSEISTCSLPVCPIDGDWTNWSSWSSCPVTCGGSNQTRSRTCDNPTPQHGGVNCSGNNQDIQACNTNFCPINGKWSLWNEWSLCTKTCGDGIQSRNRSCNNPSPNFGGLTCDGNNEDQKACSKESCPIVWSSWLEWTPCSKTCGYGKKIRIRTCPVENSCQGLNRNIDYCKSSQDCPNNSLSAKESKFKKYILDSSVTSALENRNGTQKVFLNSQTPDPISICAIHCKKFRRNPMEILDCNFFALDDNFCIFGFLKPYFIIENEISNGNFEIFVEMAL